MIFNIIIYQKSNQNKIQKKTKNSKKTSKKKKKRKKSAFYFNSLKSEGKASIVVL